MVFAFLFYTTYVEVRRKTLEDYNNRQLILIRQAARGIENFFSYYAHELQFLGGLDDIIRNNFRGRELLSSFYQTNQQEISALTRMSAQGEILYTVPYSREAIGSDLSQQRHVQEVLKTKRPVVSDVFTAVQGYQAVAYHVPLFKGEVFVGTLAVLIPFEVLTKKYLEDMSFYGKNCVWAISELGVELYCAHSGEGGCIVPGETLQSPSMKAVIGRMKAAENGFGQYAFQYQDEHGYKTVKKYVVFSPVELGNTHWSIAMTSTEALVYANMQGFQGRLLMLALVFSIVVAVYLYTFFKAKALIAESRKRAKVETALLASESRFRSYVTHAPFGVFVTDDTGRCIDVNPAALKMTGYSRKELESMPLIQRVPEAQTAEVKKKFSAVLKEGLATGDSVFLRKDGETRVWNITVVKISTGCMIAFAYDITDRKGAEDEIKQRLKEKEVLLREIHHRVKNNLNVISSLLSLQAAELGHDNQALVALNESMHRIQSMAFVHQQLYQANDFSKIAFQNYVVRLVEHLIDIYNSGSQITFTQHLDALDLDIQLAVPCGLIVNELVTNVFKHAFPDNRKGSLSIILKRQSEGQCQLVVGDDGVGMPNIQNIDNVDTLGLKLVQVLSQQIAANLEFIHDHGTQVCVTFPIDLTER